MQQDPLPAAMPMPGPTGRTIARRVLLRTLPVVTALSVARTARAAATDVQELVVACDTTLGPALRAAGSAYANATGVRVNVFPTRPGLLVPQLERQVQNDVLVTQRGIMTAAIQSGVVANDAARGGWRNPVVMAARRGQAPSPGRSIAVCDPTPASDMNGPAILARLGMHPARTFGVIDTDTVVALVLDGTASAGLMHMTDVRANAALQVLAIVPPDVQPPLAYSAAATMLARRPDPARFVDFLLASQATALLASLGLEAAS